MDLSSQVITRVPSQFLQVAQLVKETLHLTPAQIQHQLQIMANNWELVEHLVQIHH